MHWDTRQVALTLQYWTTVMLSMRLFRSLQHLQSSCRHLHSSCCHLQSLAVMSGGQGRFSGVFPSPEGVRCSTVTCQRLNSSSPQQAIPTGKQVNNSSSFFPLMHELWGRVQWIITCLCLWNRLCVCVCVFRSACVHQFHSDNTVSWDDCGWAFPSKLCASSFPW